MTQPTQAQIDAANAYEALMVPALFGEWAQKIADAAQVQAGEWVLDVGFLAFGQASLDLPLHFEAVSRYHSCRSTTGHTCSEPDRRVYDPATISSRPRCPGPPGSSS